ncbi:MAG: FAD-dependent oxidoreductase, partial [Alphaproteobacteria bacterium]|nr:FAD-dependent oxidoreductase [Alphaproteobacteria bacterium]
LLNKDEPELVDSLRRQLIAEGVIVHEGIDIERAAREQCGITLTLSGGADPITGSHLLVAAGRRPRLQGLELEKAGVAFTDGGITVDARLRTSNPHIYAIGDIAGGPQFTHVAGYHAGLVIRNALFRLPAKTDYSALPWVTYSDPELAHVGLTEAEARRRFGDDVQVTHTEFSANDRAQAERDSSGGIKVVTRANGVILGASILGHGAGELLPLWGLAITRKLKLSAMTAVIFPYPTRSELSKSTASAFYTPRLFSRWPRLIVRLLALLG